LARAATTAALATRRTHTPAPPQAKARARTASPWFALDTSSNVTWMPRDTTAFAREGFMQNAIANLN
jgi:hypothetical protein